jgi:hypothetical protein
MFKSATWCLCALTLLGCELAADNRSLDEIVDSWLAEQSLTRAGDCGALATCTLDDSQMDEEAMTCLDAAWAACEARVGSWTQTTVEGDPIHSLVVPVPDGDGCQLAVFIDTREDAYGSPSVLVQRCSGLTREEAACPPIDVDGCGTVETLVGG